MKTILIKTITIASLVILIIGCASTANKPETPTEKKILQAKNLALSGDNQQAAKIYLGLANQEKSPAKDKLLLRAVDLYLKSGDNQQAQKVAASINSPLLNPREKVLYHLLYGKAEIGLDHHRKALKELEQVSPGLLAEPEQQLYHILKVKAFEGLGRDIESVQERIKLSKFLKEGDAFEHNNRQISNTLAQVNTAKLINRRSSAPQTLRGWIDYALIVKETMPGSSERERYLQRWSDEYPGHEAIYSANTTEIEGRSPFNVPANIAVILPHSGSYTAATHAIKQGILTARDEQVGQITPKIKFYDSTAGDIATIYQRTISDGAELIIGPLEKQTIQQLLVSSTLEKPVLALNQLDGITKNDLYQFGINPRDEIEQAAALAWQHEHRYALAFVPDTKIGQRAGHLFADYWEAIGGTNLEMVTYSSNPKELVKSISRLLNLDESMNRRRQMQKVVGKLDFTTRPRDDADMLFMLAKPKIARIIRPLLDFYRVGDLPVYSTSKVYSGKPNPSLDRDLSGLVFCGDVSQFDETIQQAQLEAGSSHQVAERNIPLFNLGYDSYNLMSALPELQQSSAQRMSGKIGQLWLDDNNLIRRQLKCGQFVDGNVKSLGAGPILKAATELVPLHEQLQPSEDKQNEEGLYKKSWQERANENPVNF
ncbi:MAG: penicillin-binding protein activator [Methylococcales bacterium]